MDDPRTPSDDLQVSTSPVGAVVAGYGTYVQAQVAERYDVYVDPGYERQAPVLLDEPGARLKS